MNEQEKALAQVIIGSAILGGIAACYLTGRAERKKRQKIVAWEQENIACIKNAKARLYKLIGGDDPLDVVEFHDVLREELIFLDIVRNQPKY